MGLRKFGQYGYEKITDWTDEQIQEKIEECEYEIKEEYNSYLMYRAYKQREINYLKDELSIRNTTQEAKEHGEPEPNQE